MLASHCPFHQVGGLSRSLTTCGTLDGCVHKGQGHCLTSTCSQSTALTLGLAQEEFARPTRGPGPWFNHVVFPEGVNYTVSGNGSPPPVSALASAPMLGVTSVSAQAAVQKPSTTLGVAVHEVARGKAPGLPAQFFAESTVAGVSLVAGQPPALARNPGSIAMSFADSSGLACPY